MSYATLTTRPLSQVCDTCNIILHLVHVHSLFYSVDKIVTGSLEGTLRIYAPQAQSAFRRRRKRHAEDGKDGDDGGKEDEALTSLSAAAASNSTGVLYEERTGSPILQVLSGRLYLPASRTGMSSPKGELPLALAILHPHKLVICSVQREAGVGVTCTRVTEHAFSSTGPHFTAANMALLPVARMAAQAQAYAFGAPVLDSIAVQSLDGQICIYEGSRFVSRTAVPGILLPAPLACLPQQGMLAALTSDMVLHGYAQAGLQEAKAAAGGGSGSTVPPAPPPAWSVNLGEHSHFIMAGSVWKGTAGMVGGGGQSSDIVVLGARTMFVLSHTSSVSTRGVPLVPTMRLQRRLGFTPRAACLASAEGQHNILLASPKGVLHAFRESSLVWAARLPFIPCSLSLGTYGSTPGLLTVLSPTGAVAVVYMGTEPPAPGARLAGGHKPTTVAEYMRMQSETVTLQAAIKSARESAGGDGSARGGQGGEVLALAAHVPDRADAPGATKAGVQLPSNAPVEAVHAVHISGHGVSPLSPGGDWERWEDSEEEMEERRRGGTGKGAAGGGTGFVATIKLNLLLTEVSNGLALRNVSISCHAPAWTALPISLRSMVIPWVGRGTGAAGGEEQGTVVYLPIKARRAGMPTNEPLTVTVSYTPVGPVPDGGSSGTLSVAPTLRVLTLAVPLPTCLGMRVQPPVKTATYKLTVDINRPTAPALSSLFSDLLQGQPESHTPAESIAAAEGTAAAVLSLAFSCGGDVTLLTSKSAGRIRVQSGTLEGLLPGVHALCGRLASHADSQQGQGGETAGPLVVSTADALPMADVGQIIDEHLSARLALVKAHALLADRAQEYRLVAKRLLVRFKDRNPAPLGGLDVLLEAAAQHVQAAGQAVEECKHDLIASSGRLTSAVRLLRLLLPMKYPHLCTPPSPSLPLLLSALPATVADGPEGGWEETTEAALSDLLKGSTGGGQGSSVRPSSLSLPEDSARLKRVLGVLVDRLGKGWAPALA